MRPVTFNRMSSKNGHQSDDDSVRYKLNTNYFNANKSPAKPAKKPQVVKKEVKNEDDDIRYKFPIVLVKSKRMEQKPKTKPKIKVNFWSNKQSSRLQDNKVNKDKSSRRHTIASTSKTYSPPKPKNAVVKVRKRVSFLPSPLFSDNHVPMVTVPDDLTIQLNEEEANDLGEDFNDAFLNSDVSTKKAKSSTTQTSPRSSKRKRSSEDSQPRIHENELEFFSKYVVQKLRRMETNQRIYSENLINTVLMLGQLGKLNGKSKIGEA